MKRILAGLLVFLFLALPALAENQIDLSTSGFDGLSAHALPDGRILFAGAPGKRAIIKSRKQGLFA